MNDKWLNEYIDKELNEKTVEPSRSVGKKYYEFEMPVVYDTSELRDLK